MTDLKPILLRVFVKSLTLLLYVVRKSLFFWYYPKKLQRDDSLTAGQKNIWNLGIEYWKSQLLSFNIPIIGKNITELGSGNGQWLVSCQKLGALSVTGVEPNPKIYDICKSNIARYNLSSQIRLYNQTAEDTCLESNSSDVILCIGVFMFTDHERCLSEIARISSKDSYVVLSSNGLGYALMYLIDGLKFSNYDKLVYGVSLLINSLLLLIFGRQVGTSAVSIRYLTNLAHKYGLELRNVSVWLPADSHYALEYLFFPTNYLFIFRKSVTHE